MMTNEWMFIVLRQAAEYKGINVNSLGFLGLLFATDETQYKILTEKKPIEFLQALTKPMHDRHDDEFFMRK